VAKQNSKNVKDISVTSFDRQDIGQHLRKQQQSENQQYNNINSQLSMSNAVNTGLSYNTFHNSDFQQKHQQVHGDEDDVSEGEHQNADSIWPQNESADNTLQQQTSQEPKVVNTLAELLNVFGVNFSNRDSTFVFKGEKYKIDAGEVAKDIESRGLGIRVKQSSHVSSSKMSERSLPPHNL